MKAKVEKWSLTDWPKDRGKRNWINPECLAGLLGAMLDYNIDFLEFRGASNKHGGAYPSVSHVNGVKTDIGYFHKDRIFPKSQVLLEHEELHLQLNIDFINALIEYGYEAKIQFMTEKFIPFGESKERLLVDGMGECYTPDHDNHLHIGGFNFKKVTIKKGK